MRGSPAAHDHAGNKHYRMVSGIGKYAGHAGTSIEIEVALRHGKGPLPQGSTTGTQVRNMSRLETTSGEFELRHAMDKQTDQ